MPFNPMDVPWIKKLHEAAAKEMLDGTWRPQAQPATPSVWDDIKGAVSSVYNDVSGWVDTGVNLPNKILDTAGSIVTNLGNNVENLGSSLGNSLSMPLVMGLGVGGLFLLMMMKK